MKSLLVVATVLACVSGASDLVAPQFTGRFLWDRFQRFKARYNKEYASAQEEQKAFEAYSVNVYTIAKDKNLGETEFADQTFEDFSNTHLMQKSSREAFLKTKRTWPKTKRPISEAAMNVTAWDWRQHGAVTKIKNQKNCGSCWSFSAAGNAEGQWALYNGTLVSLSEQELVSCDQKLFNDACQGGTPQVADSWIADSADGYWTLDTVYPYTSGHGKVAPCQKDLVGRQDIAGARIAGWELVHDWNEPKMAAWMVEHGPIGVCLDATDKWMHYQGGVMTDCGKVPPLKSDHCVLLVGFNNTEATPYWIVKNSWGTNWGEEGYLYLEKGKNLCNVAQTPYSAVAKKWE